MGLLSTDPDGAIEIDFVKVKYGEVFPESNITVDGVTGLTCTADGSDVTLTWTNAQSYDRIDVTGAGGGDSVTAMLMDGEEEISFTDLADGDWTFTVTPQNGGMLAPASTCSLTLPEGGVTGLTCTGSENDVTLSWTNAHAYDQIDVSGTNGDDTVSDTLAGNAEGTAFTGLADGDWTFTVAPVLAGEPAPEANCTVTLPAGGTGPNFKRGDANRDGTANIADAVYVLANLFADGPDILCPDAADGNDDETVNIADAVYILANLFADGPDIPAPNPDCGPDTTGHPTGGDDLDPCTYCSEACQTPPSACQ
jgi:hypothetical protein